MRFAEKGLLTLEDVRNAIKGIRIRRRSEHLSPDIFSDSGKAEDGKTSLIYSSPNHLHNLMKSDYPYIYSLFGDVPENITVFRFIGDSIGNIVESKLTPMRGTRFSSNEFFVDRNKMILGAPECGYVPGTNILIAKRDYGFICRNKDFDSVRKFIESIKLSPDSYNKDSLEKVFWTKKNISLKKDVEFFSVSNRWFEQRDLPYARSYLLYGPPGNGKTSAIRAISRYFYSPPSQFSFTGRYEDPDSAFQSWVIGDDPSEEDDYYFDDTRRDKGSKLKFVSGHENQENPRIRILLLEDIDRFFSKEEGFKTPVSFSTILNALDGVFQRKNSILIATANNPEKIDSQVLFRPGRFDLRVPFESPSEEEMFSFLKHISTHDRISESTLERSVKIAVGHSFAFAKGIYLSAANRAFSRSSNFVEDSDFAAALEELVENLGPAVKTTRNRAGF